MRISLITFLLFLCSFSYSQTKISGTVHDSSTEKPLYNATVILEETGQELLTDRIGYFQYIDISPGIYTIKIIKEGYQDYHEKITISTEKHYRLGDIYITYNPKTSGLGIISLNVEALNADDGSMSSSVGLLNASKNAFLQTAAYDWGAFWFRTRGLNNNNNEVLINGFKMNKANNGRVNYGNWGGLNDITRTAEESVYGINATDNSFGDLGGLAFYDTRPSKKRIGTSFSYSLTNRSYRNRLMLTHNTGLNKNGWGILASASRRWANEGQTPGTLYDAWAYFLSIEKRFNNEHSLTLTTFGAPYRRAGNSPNTQEVYDLKGIDYNSYWGFQNGDKRSERVKRNFEPVFQISHHWNIDLKNQLKTTLSYQTGSNKSSRLNWYKANNPSPSYYKNLPSYYYYYNTKNKDELSAEEKDKYQSYINSWKSDESWTQLNWENLYKINSLQTNGNAVYYVADDVNDDDKYGFYSKLRSQIKDNLILNTGINFNITKSHLYREVKDLLGGEYALNIDDFSDIGDSGEYDELNSNNKIIEGDAIEYNFKTEHKQYEFFAHLNYKLKAWEFNLAGKLSYTEINRNGLFDHYLYDNSLGESEKVNFTNYGGKLNVLYKLNGNNFIRYNGTYFTKAPTVAEVFPMQRTNNIVQPNIKSSQILSNDISYIYRSPSLKAQITGYYSNIKNLTQTSFGYIQLVQDNNTYDKNLFTAEVLNGVNKEYIGSEIFLETNFTKTLTATAVASIGQYIYKNNPDLYYFSDEFSSTSGYEYIGKTYLKNYKLSGSPQQAYHLGLEYRSPKYWWLGLSGNYLANQYISISPSRRTDSFVRSPNGELFPDLESSAGEKNLRDILKQEKFSNELMINLNTGKTFRLGQYYIGISLSVNNLLNNKNYKTGGFEQLRLGNYEAASNESYSKVFGNKYWYNQGISYFLNVFFRF